MTSYIDQGLGAGAQMLLGDAPLSLKPELRDGFFVAPTIFDDVQLSMRIAREEIFGPVVTVLRFRSLEEALS